MDAQAIVWTEGKTDWQHLKPAFQALGVVSRVAFQEFDYDLGDDQLLKQCVALSRVPQPKPTIFIFDRDKEEIVNKVEDAPLGYKAWGNNVYSFAIPIPAHRTARSGVCVELYYTDAELRTPDAAGRRLFLSTEFNPQSGRHLSDPRLSIGNKGKLASAAKGAPTRIIDSEVYDELSRNVALTKADFARNVLGRNGDLAGFRFDAFRAILDIVDRIIEQSRGKIDLPFADLNTFFDILKDLDPPHQLGAVVDAAIRVCKLAAMAFAAVTVRHYEQRISDAKGSDAKKVRPINRTLKESFEQPSLATLHGLAKHCYYLVDDQAPGVLYSLRAAMAFSPVLGPLGDLLDHLERVIPPPPRHGRIVNKRQLAKPVLEYVLPELAKYEGRISEITEAASEGNEFQQADSAIWRAALSMLVDAFEPVRSLPFCLRNVERVHPDSDEFTVRLTMFRDGRTAVEELRQNYADLKDDRLETYEILLSPDEGGASLELYPFLIIERDRLHYYSRTTAHGYEYMTAFDPTPHVVETNRKFSIVALRSTITTDLQGLFWIPVEPTVSVGGVKANIPAQDPIVGRTEQISTVLDEIIKIPNQNGIVYGPGGVGKTALLIEICRQLSEDPSPQHVYFKNIIWVSAKPNYYDPTHDVIERRPAQFQSLDNVLAAILEFYGLPDAGDYERDAKKWMVIEFLRDEKTLLILDNFESVAPVGQKDIIRFFDVDVKKALADKPDHFKVLVTSRETIPSGFHQFDLKGLDRQESKELMRRLYEPYRWSGKVQLTEQQLDALYETTQGIPLIIKHCYGQVFEYNRPMELVLRGLSNAGNKVVEFSFAEIFKLLKQDGLLLSTILLLELSARPLMLRQMADILGEDEAEIGHRVAGLENFQCVNRTSTGADTKFAVSDDVRFFTRGLANEYAQLAAEIKRKTAALAIEKRMDYSSEEFHALVLFNDYSAQGHYVLGEDFILEVLKKHPASILLNLHYAKYLKEIKGKVEDAIGRLERIRAPSGNDPQVLRLLVAYYTALEPPNFDQAYTYACELEGAAADSVELKFELARFYVSWSTALKLRFELDPLKNMVRIKEYKDLADRAIEKLKEVRPDSHSWHHLVAQSYYNKWDYDLALRHVEKAIDALPRGSHLAGPYKRLKGEILKKRAQYASGSKRW